MNVPGSIVKRLLESDTPEDPKEFLDRNSEEMLNHWEQIDGDFGDPWQYGGSYLNAFSDQIAHLEGLEGNGVEETEAWDTELTPQDLEDINNKFPVLVDPEWPEGGDENERAREEATDALKQEKADAKNKAVKLPVYIFLDEPVEWSRLEDVARQFNPEDWERMSTAQKWLEIGRYGGFEELDSHPEYYTKEEFESFIGKRQG